MNPLQTAAIHHNVNYTHLVSGGHDAAHSRSEHTMSCLQDGTHPSIRDAQEQPCRTEGSVSQTMEQWLCNGNKISGGQCRAPLRRHARARKDHASLVTGTEIHAPLREMYFSGGKTQYGMQVTGLPAIPHRENAPTPLAPMTATFAIVP